MNPGDRYRNSLNRELEVVSVDFVDADLPTDPWIEVVAYRYLDSGSGYTHLRRVDKTTQWVKIETPS